MAPKAILLPGLPALLLLLLPYSTESFINPTSPTFTRSSSRCPRLHTGRIQIRSISSPSALRSSAVGGPLNTTTVIAAEALRGPREAIVNLESSSLPQNINNDEVDWDAWWIGHMEEWYEKAFEMKCPFLRRRVSDFLDGFDAVLRHVVLLDPDRMGPPLAYRCEEDAPPKSFGMSADELATQIRKDWREDTRKGYYITGRINTSLYRDDCLFDGPDPDMPVRGLRKYRNAASKLFDQKESASELVSLRIEDGLVVARWRMQGRLRLPWRPVLPVVMGTTTYHTDSDGLIYLHEETWDVSVFRAFLQTFWPELAHHIWNDDNHAQDGAE